MNCRACILPSFRLLVTSLPRLPQPTLVEDLFAVKAALKNPRSNGSQAIELLARPVRMPTIEAGEVTS
jgi:hypothetical protein